MAFSTIKIENLRNFAEVSFKPHQHMNIIVGDNGSGKSSVLESICFLCRGKSFRTSHVPGVITRGKDDFVVFGINDDSRIGIRRNHDSFEIKINGENVTSLSRLARLSPVQIIHPADIELLTGSPAERRAYVDWGSFYYSSGFYEEWAAFRRIMKQRNAFLKSGVSETGILEAIDAELLVHAQKVHEFRKLFVDELAETVQSIVSDFLPEYQFEFVMYPGWDLKKGLGQILSVNLERDRMQGFTSAGPQRADLKIYANRQQVQDVLSRGQLKLLLCAMRLAQSCFLEKKCGKDCLFLLDDFASELDQSKRDKLAEYLTSLRGQVFITAIDEDETRFFQRSPCSVFELEKNLINQR